jgi:arsenate reductase
MPGVLFLCIHNAGRSQMAAGFARSLSDDKVLILSGGSEPAEHVNPVAIEVMNEIGIDIAGYVPQKFTDELLQSGMWRHMPVHPWQEVHRLATG